MKKLILLCSSLLAISLQAQIWTNPSIVGDGTTAATAWQIRDTTDLADIARYVNAGNGNATRNKYYKLMNDLDLAGWDTGDGKGWKPIGSNIGQATTAFQGNFDGNNHVVKNMTINRSDENFIGLFGHTRYSIIQHIGVVNCTVSGKSIIGTLMGYCINSTISNSYSTGSVSGGPSSNVGGLVGGSSSSSIVSNSHSTVKVSGGSNVGGLVGSNYGTSTISNSYSTGSVSATGINVLVGGLVGSNREKSTISNSYSTGSVEATGSLSEPSGYIRAGGLVGSNTYSSLISNCYSTGNVLTTGNKASVGGVVGNNFSSAIRNSMASCSSIISTQNTLDINRMLGRGYDSNSILQNNYALSSMVVKNNRIVTNKSSTNNTSLNGANKTLTELQSGSAFWGIAGNWLVETGATPPAEAWSIIPPAAAGATWTIWEGKSFPYFLWQSAPVAYEIRMQTANQLTYELRNAADSIIILKKNDNTFKHKETTAVTAGLHTLSTLSLAANDTLMISVYEPLKTISYPVQMVYNGIMQVNAPSPVVKCDGETFARLDFSGTNGAERFEWFATVPADATAIGMVETSGTDSIKTFTALNASTTPRTATFKAVPKDPQDNCRVVGDTLTFTITVNPIPTVNAVSNQTSCADNIDTYISLPVAFTGSVAGTTFNWSMSHNIGYAQTGTGNIPAFAYFLPAGPAPVTSTVTVTPTVNTCLGTPVTFTYTLNPVTQIITQPVGGIYGSVSSLSVAATGTGTLTYAWNNGVNIVSTEAAYTPASGYVPAGTYSVTITGDCGTAVTSNEVIVAPATVTVDWGNTSFTYNGSSQSPTASITGVDGNPITLSVAGGQTNAGTGYIATASFNPANTNYILNGNTTIFDIAPATVTVDWANTSLTYNGNNQAPTASITGVDGNPIALSIAGGQTNAGTGYIATASFNPANTNYILNANTTTFDIASATVTVDWANTSLTYNGSSQAPTASITGVDGNPITLSIAGGQTNAGTGYIATASFNPANTNYILNGNTTEFAIAVKPITIIAIDETIDYGQTPALAYNINPALFAGDTMSGALAVAKFEVGNHSITQGSLTAGNNYTITYNAATLTIRGISTAIDRIIVDRRILININNEYHTTTGQPSVDVVIDALDASISINIQPAVPSGTMVPVDVNYGINIIPITITAQNGNTKNYTLIVERYYDKIAYEYSDVPTMNCNPADNGGYTFTGFQWHRDGVRIEGARDPYYQIKDNAVYYCMIALDNGTIFRSIDIQGLQLRSGSSLSVYPNPTQGEVTVSQGISQGFTSSETLTEIQVFDLKGKLVLQPTENPFDMSALPQGMYVIKVNGQTVKVVKK